MNKKANFNLINAGIISFVGFVLVTLMVIFILSTLKQTSLVCDPTQVANASVTAYNGECYQCNNNATSTYAFNSSAGNCYNTSNAAITMSTVPYSGAVYNGTKYLVQASLLPPQFASIIIIVILIVGILALLALIGYNVYQKMNQ